MYLRLIKYFASSIPQNAQVTRKNSGCPFLRAWLLLKSLHVKILELKGPILKWKYISLNNLGGLVPIVPSCIVSPQVKYVYFHSWSPLEGKDRYWEVMIAPMAKAPRWQIGNQALFSSGAWYKCRAVIGSAGSNPKSWMGQSLCSGLGVDASDSFNGELAQFAVWHKISRQPSLSAGVHGYRDNYNYRKIRSYALWAAANLWDTHAVVSADWELWFAARIYFYWDLSFSIAATLCYCISETFQAPCLKSIRSSPKCLITLMGERRKESLKTVNTKTSFKAFC